MKSLRMRPIGFVHSPFSQTDQIPRGLTACLPPGRLVALILSA